MLEKLALPEVRELIDDGDLVTLREVLNRWLPTDIADLLGDLSSKEDVVAFQCLTPVLAARTFEYLPLVAQEELLHILPESELEGILNELAPDDRTTLFEALSDDEIEHLLTLLTPENQRVSRSLLSHSEGTVGRLMTPEFIEVKERWTMEQVLAHDHAFIQRWQGVFYDAAVLGGEVAIAVGGPFQRLAEAGRSQPAKCGKKY